MRVFFLKDKLRFVHSEKLCNAVNVYSEIQVTRRCLLTIFTIINLYTNAKMYDFNVLDVRRRI